MRQVYHATTLSRLLLERACLEHWDYRSSAERIAHNVDDPPERDHNEESDESSNDKFLALLPLDRVSRGDEFEYSPEEEHKCSGKNERDDGNDDDALDPDENVEERGELNLATLCELWST